MAGEFEIIDFLNRGRGDVKLAGAVAKHGFNAIGKPLGDKRSGARRGEYVAGEDRDLLFVTLAEVFSSLPEYEFSSERAITDMPGGGDFIGDLPLAIGGDADGEPRPARAIDLRGRTMRAYPLPDQVKPLL